VVIPDEIYPNNLVYDLAHLAVHLGAAPVQPTIPPGPSTHVTNALNAFIAARLNEEARADIAGWNAVVDAAVRENGGRPLTLQQRSTMMFNLRYRSFFLQAIRQPNPKLQISNSGAIAPDDSNVAAIVAVLHNSPIADLQ
jgi:hypothetical protein